MPISSTAAPVPTGRSMQMVVVSRKVDLDAEVVGEGGLDDLLLHLAVERHGDLLAQFVLPQVDQRVLLGELGRARRAARPCRRAGPGTTTVSRDGGAKWWLSAGVVR